MAKIEMEIPDQFYEVLNALVDRAVTTANSAEMALNMSSRLVSEGSEMYVTFTEELRQQRELLEDMKQRLHALGNAINGKLGAYEAEMFIRQIVNQTLEERK